MRFKKTVYTLDDEIAVFKKMQRAINKYRYCGRFELEILALHNQYTARGEINKEILRKALIHPKSSCPHLNII